METTNTNLSYEDWVKTIVNYRLEHYETEIERRAYLEYYHRNQLYNYVFKVFLMTMEDRLTESKRTVIENSCARDAEMRGSATEYYLPNLTAIGYENGVEFILSGCRTSCNIYINKAGEITRKKQKGEKTWEFHFDGLPESYFDFNKMQRKRCESVNLYDLFSKIF